MFTNSSNTHISGPARFVHNGDTYNFGSRAESLDEGIRLLVSRVVKGAMHNSGERFDAPTCHEETRTAIQDDILGWADELIDDLNDLVTWLYGPAGAGKSAIAQTIAQKLHARGQLTASFFFSRGSGSTGRGAETDLVATLAYQLSQSVSATKPHIASAVRENPLIFEMNLRDQVDTLIVRPLTALSDALPGSEKPKVIVVDGLDECRKEHNAQRRVVDALISGLRQIPHRNHKLFITSRPEHNIVSIFNDYGEKIVRRMELNDKWKPNDDIRTFLNAAFADIRRTHVYFQGHHVDRTWPVPYSVETLVHRSSGQFIYPSVVLKYIKSEENYNPVDRLETILLLENNEDEPYAELDALYEYIFSQIRNVEKILTILFFNRYYRERLVDYEERPPFETFLSMFIGARMDEIKFWLRPLVSLLVWQEGDGDNEGKIRYIHASLGDFLEDQSRSKVFCYEAPTFVTGIVRRSIQLIEDGTAIQSPRLMIPLMRILCYNEPLHLISNFNIVENVLCKINTDFVETDAIVQALIEYLDWILPKSEAYPDRRVAITINTPVETSLPQKALIKLAAQIQIWLIHQFRHLQFNNLDNTEQIDVWPFFTSSKHEGPSFPNYILDTVPAKRIYEDLSSALEICGSSPSCHQLLRGTKFDLSNQAAILCRLMPFLRRQWLYRADFLGQYAMSEERYGLALQRTIFYILQLPKNVLVEILKSSKSRTEFLATPVMRLIYDVLFDFLTISPPTTDLYFLIAIVNPFMQYLDMDPHGRMLNYTLETLKLFPFLRDSTSSDYVRARVKIQEICNNSKIKTSFHELAEMIQNSSRVIGDHLLRWRASLDVFAVIDRRLISESSEPACSETATPSTPQIQRKRKLGSL